MNQMYRNLRETTEDACECVSWIDHHITGCREVKPPKVCSDKGCNETRDLVGAHVYWFDDWGIQQPGVYIIPLCKYHNRADAFMRRTVRPGTLFITTDRSVCREGVEKRQALTRALQGLKRKYEDPFAAALREQSVVHSAHTYGDPSVLLSLSGRPLKYEPDPYAKPAKTFDEFLAEQGQTQENALYAFFGKRK